jgi:hypothetical protein
MSQVIIKFDVQDPDVDEVDDREAQVEHALDRVLKGLTFHPSGLHMTSGVVHDVNGNAIGSWSAR